MCAEGIKARTCQMNREGWGGVVSHGKKVFLPWGIFIRQLAKSTDSLLFAGAGVDAAEAYVKERLLRFFPMHDLCEMQDGSNVSIWEVASRKKVIAEHHRRATETQMAAAATDGRNRIRWPQSQRMTTTEGSATSSSATDGCSYANRHRELVPNCRCGSAHARRCCCYRPWWWRGEPHGAAAGAIDEDVARPGAEQCPARRQRRMASLGMP